MLFHDFECIWVVNLPHRKDRRAEMESQLAKVGLLGDPRVKFFEALSFEDAGPFRRVGSHGAFKSHLALLSRAEGPTLILQDDCDFLLPAVLDYELPPDWDIFYGGYVATDPENPEAGDIIGAHFMGFSGRAAKAAAAYLTAYLEPNFQPDPRASREPGFDPAFRPPIDGALVWFRRAHPELRTVFAMLGMQRASRTDIGDQKWFDKLPLIRGLAELTRKVLRRWRRADGGRSYVFRNSNLGQTPTNVSRDR